MANLNRIFLIGNLVRDPELRYVPSGDAVANLRLAINRTYTTKEGEKREETCFVTVVVWRRQAETCCEYLNKGSPVFVEGRLQSRTWETGEGEKRSVLEVRADRVQFLGRKSDRVSEGEETGAANEAGPVGDNSLSGESKGEEIHEAG